jgi:hypothetical protein
MANFCHECGHKAGTSDRYCIECGAELDSEQGASGSQPGSKLLSALTTSNKSAWVIGGLAALALIAAISIYAMAPVSAPLGLAGNEPKPSNTAAPIKDIGFLGIEFADVRAERVRELKLASTRGVEIISIKEKTPAHSAALKGADVIVKVGSRDVADMADFSQKISSQKPGSDVDLTVMRDGVFLKVPVTMGGFISDLTPLAEAGDLYGMRTLAQLYLGDRLGKPYPEEGLAWLRKAADHNDAWSLSQLGRLYWSGDHVEKDHAKGFDLFRRGAEAGDVAAMLSVANFSYEGKLAKRNFTVAMRYWRMAAEKGNAEAMRWVGNLYRNGEGVSRDMAQSTNWYQKAAEAGDSVSMYNLAVSYHYGTGIGRDYGAAARWYQSAIEGGYERASFNLAVLHLNGQGVGRDHVRAAQLVVRAIKVGHDHAVREMTTNTSAGSSEFRRELQEALRREGAYDGPVDGRLGAQSTRAIKWLAERAQSKR